MTRLFLILGLLMTSPLWAATQTQVELILSHKQTVPGEEILAGVRLTMPEGWHSYWKNSGDSGSPTTIKWELPDGFEVGEVRWPLPEKYTDQGFTTYVHHDVAVLIIPLQVSNDVAPGHYTLEGKVDWQECEKVCILGSTSVSASIQVADTSITSDDQSVILDALKKLPVESGDNLEIQGRWLPPKDEDNRSFILSIPGDLFDSQPDFYPYGFADYDVMGETIVGKDGGLTTLEKGVFLYEGSWPTSMEGVLIGSVDGETKGYEVQFKLNEEGETSESPSTGTISGDRAGSTGLWKMLLFGFIGGLILNIMPCVLPVISLKVLGFVQQSQETPGRSRLMGLIYALGVLSSFTVLALVAVGVKHAGGAANWGMAFQNPVFRVVITAVMTLVALNLFGVFEINLGGKTMNAAGKMASKDGPAGAFMNGILASILATPCTAPFLSAAMTFAFTQPGMVIVAMFLMVGLGLASPFVILCWQPGWLKFLPKPGPWMHHFKVMMGFPMLAAAIWLFSFTAPRMGRGGVLWFGVFLLLLAFAAWLFGTFIQHASKRKPFAWAFIIAVLLLDYGYVLEKELNWRTPVRETGGMASLKSSPDGIPWQVWSHEAVKQALEQGHPVLVDFTAEYCWNCKLNKKTSLEIESTRLKLKEIGAVSFLADYTDPNPVMTEMLNKYNRPGVPLVLVYSPDDPENPIVLPEILTPGIVHKALDKVAPSPGST